MYTWPFPPKGRWCVAAHYPMSSDLAVRTAPWYLCGARVYTRVYVLEYRAAKRLGPIIGLHHFIGMLN